MLVRPLRSLQVYSDGVFLCELVLAGVGGQVSEAGSQGRCFPLTRTASWAIRLHLSSHVNWYPPPVRVVLSVLGFVTSRFITLTGTRWPLLRPTRSSRGPATFRLPPLPSGGNCKYSLRRALDCPSFFLGLQPGCSRRRGGRPQRGWSPELGAFDAVGAACPGVQMVPGGKAFLSENKGLFARFGCLLAHVAVCTPPAARRSSPAHPASAGCPSVSGPGSRRPSWSAC